MYWRGLTVQVGGRKLVAYPCSDNKKAMSKIPKPRTQHNSNIQYNSNRFFRSHARPKEVEYKPYSKPGNNLLYVNTDLEANHPTIVTSRIPQSIESRLSNASST